MAELAMTIIFFAVIGWFAIRWVKKRARDMAGLVSLGETALGKVVMAQRVRRSRTHKSCLVRYTFVAKDGVEYEREIEVKPQEFEQYSEGQTIDIVYDPTNPETSMLQSAVRDARAATNTQHAPR